MAKKQKKNSIHQNINIKQNVPDSQKADGKEKGNTSRKK